MVEIEDFIRRKIREDLEANIVSHIHTRFPPEPNGYLHIGHAKSIALNFGVAEEISQQGSYKGVCNLRFDDTNPEKEETEYIDTIKRDIRWLGYDWEEREYYASDYFQKMYEYAVLLVKKGYAFIDHTSPEEIKQMRGTPTRAGTESIYRNRSVEENLQFFSQMKNGELAPGTCLLRAKIDMAHPNLVMRDPPLYRIRHVSHHRTGDAWNIYPMYDFAHCLSDAIEHITHSLCTLEFEIHRPLYEWILEKVDLPKPHPVQTEFARLSITHTVLSKRKMKIMVDKQLVSGWDDPRMPTIAGLRRRGFTPSVIRAFCKDVGVTKSNTVIEYARLEEIARQEFNEHAMRVMTVLDPIPLIIDNYPEDQEDIFVAENNPARSEDGTHELPFSRTLYIERSDVMEDPPKGYNRLAIGKEVRLKYAYYVVCTKIVKDSQGNIIEVHADYDPESKGGGTPDKRKVRGTIHWVSCKHCSDVHINLLGTLFTESHPDQHGDDFLTVFNHDSKETRNSAKAEIYLQTLIEGYQKTKTPYPIQFLRSGYFMLDMISSQENQVPIFNKTVSLKDGWKGKANPSNSNANSNSQ